MNGPKIGEAYKLIINVDRILKNHVFVEELIDSAPKIKGWKLSAHKPAVKERFSIKMAGYEFSTNNIHFYPNEDLKYSDEVDITNMMSIVRYQLMSYINAIKTDNPTHSYPFSLYGGLKFSKLRKSDIKCPVYVTIKINSCFTGQ